MSVFALVHGSMHGGWCWRDLIPELERRGHGAVAPDLPCEDAAAGPEEYAVCVEAAIGDARDVILVGHSLGGRTLPLLATRRPVRAMVFLCCVPTGIGAVSPESFVEMVTPEFRQAKVSTRADGARRMRADSARAVFYHDCPPEVADWAADSLRWQGERHLSEALPLQEWPATPLQVILARHDRAVRFEWAQREARRWLGGREPLLLDGDHSPFLSRPAQLAELLASCASGEVAGFRIPTAAPAGEEKQ